MHLLQRQSNDKCQLPNKSLLDLVEYAWSHPKRNKTFTGNWSYFDLLHTVAYHVGLNTLRYSTGRFGEITGLVLYNTDGTNVYVKQILSDDKASLRSFLCALRREFPVAELSGLRRGQPKIYTTKAKELLYGR